MRLRILDISIKRLWFVAFFQRAHGEPFFRCHLYNNTHGNWFHFWEWEDLPDERPQEARSDAEIAK